MSEEQKPISAVILDAHERRITRLEEDMGGIGKTIVKIEKDVEINNSLTSEIGRDTREIRDLVKSAGTNVFLAGRAFANSAPYKLALSIVGNSCCVLFNAGAGWVYLGPLGDSGVGSLPLILAAPVVAFSILEAQCKTDALIYPSVP